MEIDLMKRPEHSTTPEEINKLVLEMDGTWSATDDVNVGTLDPDDVKAAREEEFGYVYKRKVFA